MGSIKWVSRRGVLREIAIGGATIATASLLSACGSSGAAAPTSSPVPSGTLPRSAPVSEPETDVIMLIRHAEKPMGSSGPHGIAADGTESAGSLTVVGWTRAGGLVELFAPARGTPPEGLRTPTAVWAADPRGDEGQRPLQTITPLAARLGIPVNTQFGKGHTTDLAAALSAGHGAALVAWQHQEIPVIVGHLTGVTPKPPQFWPNDRYDVVWVFTRSGAGWAFRQVPQLLLAGDRPEII